MGNLFTSCSRIPALTLYDVFLEKLENIDARDSRYLEEIQELKNWIKENLDNVYQILSKFDPDGKPLKDGIITATTYSDLYKWAMSPSIRIIQKSKLFKHSNINVKFSVDLRNQKERDVLEVIMNDPESRALFLKNLQELANRKFDVSMFKDIVKTKNLSLDKESIENICGTEENPRSLADEIITKDVPYEDNGKVVINIYKAHDKKLRQERYYIQATGPWHRVTWLETTLMQCVYETLLRHDLAVKDISYVEWLVDFLLRCQKSVKVCNAKTNIKGYLFAGRRVGSYPSLLLQHLYLQTNYKYFGGSSSVDSCFFFRNNLTGIKFIIIVGTHAHELQMVLSSLLSEFDDRANRFISLVIAHVVFFMTIKDDDIKSRKIVILPDTLGTEYFMHIASNLTIKIDGDDVPFLDIISGVRQDSGLTSECPKIVYKYMKDRIVFFLASEIDTCLSIEELEELYNSFGAGGFFGDSERAHDPSKSSISMAVKAVCVYLGTKAIDIRPIKTGDTTDGGKFSIDTSLTEEEIDNHKIRLARLRDTSTETEEMIRNIQLVFSECLSKFF